MNVRTDYQTVRAPVIEMQDVKRVYTMGDQEVHALRGISFAIREGEFVSIMGPSGSGKSTCMNMIGCLDRPTAGIVKINGKETAKMDEKELAYLRNKTVGFVFQQYFLLNSMSVLETSCCPCAIRALRNGSGRRWRCRHWKRWALPTGWATIPTSFPAGRSSGLQSHGRP